MPDPRQVLLVHGAADPLTEPLVALLTAMGLRPVSLEQLQPTLPSPFAGSEDFLNALAQRVPALLVLPSAEAPALLLAALAWRRHPQGVILLHTGDQHPYGPAAGQQALLLEDSPAWRQDLAQRLTAAGCLLDLHNSAWLRAGDFTAALCRPDAEQERILTEISNSYSNRLPLERLAQALGRRPAQLKAGLNGLIRLGYLAQRTDEFGVTFYNVAPPGTDYLLGKGLM